MNKLPEFIVVGAAKSGTTTVYETLIKHEKVFVPQIKECRFFSQMPRNFRGGLAAKFQNEGPRILEEYLKLFQFKEHLIKGDISNDYFYYYKNTIKNIKFTYKKLNQQEPKILIFLRSPLERVFSMYAMSIKLKSETLSFIDAFKKSEERIKNNYAWIYDLQGLGYSFEATNAYFNNFEHVKIILTDHLNDYKTWEGIFNFLEVEKCLIKKIRSNTNHYSKPRSIIFMKIFAFAQNIWLKNKKFLNKRFLPITIFKNLFYKLDKFNSFGRSLRLSKKDKFFLINFYKSDIEKLSQLINRNLKKWLE